MVCYSLPPIDYLAWMKHLVHVFLLPCTTIILNMMLVKLFGKLSSLLQPLLKLLQLLIWRNLLLLISIVVKFVVLFVCPVLDLVLKRLTFPWISYWIPSTLVLTSRFNSLVRNLQEKFVNQKERSSLFMSNSLTIITMR